MEYKVLVYKAEEGGYWAKVPSLKEEEEKIPKEEDFFISRINIAESAVA
jgi:hypothetical protein